jgi:hypothetical protein
MICFRATCINYQYFGSGRENNGCLQINYYIGKQNNTGQKIQNEARFGGMYLFIMAAPQRVPLHVNQRIPLHNHPVASHFVYCGRMLQECRIFQNCQLPIKHIPSKLKFIYTNRTLLFLYNTTETPM